MISRCVVQKVKDCSVYMSTIHTKITGPKMDFYLKAIQLCNAMLMKQCDVYTQIKFTLTDTNGRICREMSVCLEKHDDDEMDYVYHMVTSRTTYSHRMNSTTHRLEHLDMNIISNELIILVHEMTLNPLIYPVCNITCKLFSIMDEAPGTLRDIIYRLTNARKDPVVVKHNGMMTLYFEGLIL